MSFSDTQKLIQSKLDELLTDFETGRIQPHHNGQSVAIFKAERLDGSIHVGWHYTPLMTQPGERFHYDHGIGIERNTDGQYLWVAPLTQEIIQQKITKAHSGKSFEISGLFTYEDGHQELGHISSSKLRIDTPPDFYLNRYPVLNTGAYEHIKAISLLPLESLDIWTPASTRPDNDGDMVMVWDNDKARQSYSGPYFDVAKFDASGKTNKRYQNYGGPMVGGFPWVSIKSYQTIDNLFILSDHKRFIDAMENLIPYQDIIKRKIAP